MGTQVNFGTQQYFNFEPRQLPGCILWLDAGDSNTMFSDTAGTTLASTGGTVARWNDKSSNANYFSQATAGNRPTYTAAGQNGSNVLTFAAGSSNFLTGSNAALLPTSTNGYSAFLVGKSTLAATVQVFLRWGGTTNGTSFQLYTNASSQLEQNYWNVGVSTDSTAVTNNTFIFSSSSTTTTAGPFRNGTAFTTTTNYAYNFGTPTIANIGYQQTGNFYLTGTICEIVIFSRNLTTAERQQVEGYLGWRWGVYSNLPTGHPYLYNPTYMRSFQPPDVDGNSLWLDSADQDSNSMTLSGTTITTWKDKSGNAKDFTSQLSPVIGTLSNRPIVDTTGGGCFTNGSFSIPIVYSGFISGYSTITAASNTWSGLLYGTPDARFMLRAYQAVLYIWKGDGGVWGSPSSTGPDATSNAVYSFVNPSSAGAVTLYVNGTSNHVNSGVANIATSGLDIGRWVNNSYPWKGYIGDVIFYSNAVSDADRQRLEGYLAWKMNIRGGLATTHPFRNFPPSTAAFHPMFLSNSTLWLDGADSTSNSMTFSGANITVWKDKSSNAKNFTASGTGATLGTSPPGLVFTTNLYTSTHNASITTNETMFLVFRSTKASAPSFPIGSSGSGGRELGFRTTTSFGVVNNGVEWGAQQTAASNVTYFCKSIITNGFTTQFSINGSALSTSNIAAFSGSRTTQLGRENAAAFQYEGTICEVIAYSRVLTVDEQWRVDAYLAWKWNLQSNLPTSNPYYKFRS